MRFGDWHKHSSWRLKHRLRAAVCLFLYTHNFWANGVSEHTRSLSPQETQLWQSPAHEISEAQS